MYNHIQVIGHLGKDPEMSYTPNGNACTKFSVATSRRWNQNGEKKEQTTWFNVVCWQKLGETANSYLHKGSKVMIAGRMESRKYTDKNNVERDFWEITASELVMLDNKPADSNGHQGGDPTLAAEEVPF